MNVEVTKEMMEVVASAQLYREDYMVELRKVLSGKKLTSSELNQLYINIIKHPDFKQVKEDILNIEKSSLVEDDMDTVMLQYNKLLRDAQKEGKFEVAARILKEIREIKAIENEQTKFEVIIKVEKPEKDNK